jgi:hypothetical protein
MNRFTIAANRSITDNAIVCKREYANSASIEKKPVFSTPRLLLRFSSWRIRVPNWIKLSYLGRKWDRFPSNSLIQGPQLHADADHNKVSNEW